jgi:hypothetical protein
MAFGGKTGAAAKAWQVERLTDVVLAFVLGRLLATITIASSAHSTEGTVKRNRKAF